MGPSLAVEGSTTKEVFEAYLEQVLLPEVHEGQVLIMDKLPAHKPNRMRELIEERGCELFWDSPSYSPDFNPIEEQFLQDQGNPTQGVCQDSRGPPSKRWAKRYPRSAYGMPGDSSSTPVTILQVNYYETCCMRTAGSSPLWMSSYIRERGTPKYSAASGTFTHSRRARSIVGRLSPRFCLLIGYITFHNGTA